MKALINALTLALVEANFTSQIEDARDFATAFVEENADLLSPQPVRVAAASLPQVTADFSPRYDAVLVSDDIERAPVYRVPVVGADGLTDKQRAAVGGVGLCANCQQPNNDHLPACAKASGLDKRAVTKEALPPSV
jgi:hypothetical protein